jgi:hypothetical protein
LNTHFSIIRKSQRVKNQDFFVLDQLEIVDIDLISLALYSQADWYQFSIKKILIFKLVNTLGNIKSLFSLFIVIQLFKKHKTFMITKLQCTQTKKCFNPIHREPLSTDITELIPSTSKNKQQHWNSIFRASSEMNFGPKNIGHTSEI